MRSQSGLAEKLRSEHEPAHLFDVAFYLTLGPGEANVLEERPAREPSYRLPSGALLYLVSGSLLLALELCKGLSHVTAGACTSLRVEI